MWPIGSHSQGYCTMADEGPRESCHPNQRPLPTGSQTQEVQQQACTAVPDNGPRQMGQAGPEIQDSAIASGMANLKMSQTWSAGTVHVPGDNNPSFLGPVTGSVTINYNVTSHPKDSQNQAPQNPGGLSDEPCGLQSNPAIQDTSRHVTSPGPDHQKSPAPRRVVTHEEMHTAANACETAIKSHYKTTGSYVQMIPWIDDDTKHIMDIYTTLMLKDEGYATLLDSYQDIFLFKTREGEAIKRAILSGLAGRGKSTLLDKMSYDWAVFSQALRMFKLVFVLKMCALEHNSELTDAIFDQLLDQDTDIDRLALREFIHNYPGRILILLDGFDEFTMSTVKICPDSILGIINRKVGRECWVVVTTRPSHFHSLVSKQMIQDPFTHVLVAGFSSENIKEYVTRFFSSEPVSAAGLIEKIQSSSVMSDLGQSPMLLLLMCLLWRNEGSLPETTTRLYDEAIQYVFRRKADMSPEEIAGVVIALGKVALLGLLSPDRLLCFAERDFEENALEVAVKVGLFTKQRAVGKGLRVFNSVHFIHKTIQEYCAAKYVHTLSEDEVQRTFDRVDVLDGYEYLLRFCCGDNHTCTRVILRMLERCFSTEQEPGTPVSGLASDEQHETRRRKLALSCSLESQSKTLPLDFTSSILTPEISLSGWDRDSLHGLSFLMQSVALASENARKAHLTKVEKVSMVSCKVGKFCKDLAHSVESMTNLEQVQLVRCSLTATHVSDVASSLSQASSLTTLDLSHNTTLRGSANVWSPSLAHLKSLKSLTLRYCSLVPNDWMPVLQTLSELPRLADLDMSFNNETGFPGSKCFTHLRYCKSLQRLNLSNCSLRGDDVTQIFTSLSYLTRLADLNLCWNESISGSASEWSHHLEDCRHLKRLNLRHCSLTWEDLKQVATSSREMPSLKELHLSSHEIGSDSIASWCFLEQMKALHKLDVECRSLTGSVLKHVIELLGTVTNLVELNLTSNEALEQSMTVWCPQLKDLKNLRRLTLDDYRSDRHDLSCLALAVGQMPNILECVISYEYMAFELNTLVAETILVAQTGGGIFLNLCECCLGTDAIATILKTMVERGDLVELNLGGNELSSSQAVWSKHLKNLKLLRKLDLRFCPLTSQNVKEIQRALGSSVEVNFS